MVRGWLIYNQKDLEKNQVFADMLVAYGKLKGLAIQLFVREEVCLGIDEEGLTISVPTGEEVPDFVINRTRDTLLAEQLMYKGVKVFNSAQVTGIANDKIKAHQFVNRLGIPSVKTFFYDATYHQLEQIQLQYPLVVKTVDGHGGEEVCCVHDFKALQACVTAFERRTLIIQETCSQVGVDVRVFVVGNQVIAAIKRCSQVDFRSNFSLGGTATLMAVDKVLEAYVKTIVEELACDCVGIDFMIDQEGSYLFNEIEDVVGSRSLYQNSEVDLAHIFIEHIGEIIENNKKYRR